MGRHVGAALCLPVRGVGSCGRFGFRHVYSYGILPAEKTYVSVLSRLRWRDGYLVGVPIAIPLRCLLYAAVFTCRPHHHESVACALQALRRHTVDDGEHDVPLCRRTNHSRRTPRAPATVALMSALFAVESTTPTHGPCAMPGVGGGPRDHGLTGRRPGFARGCRCEGLRAHAQLPYTRQRDSMAVQSPRALANS